MATAKPKAISAREAVEHPRYIVRSIEYTNDDSVTEKWLRETAPLTHHLVTLNVLGQRWVAVFERG